MQKYQNNAKMLAQLGCQDNEIFYFDSGKIPNHYAELFTKLFEFSHVNLTEEWEHFPVQPGIFFFKDDDRANARTWRFNFYNLCLPSGTNYRP